MGGGTSDNQTASSTGYSSGYNRKGTGATNSYNGTANSNGTGTGTAWGSGTTMTAEELNSALRGNIASNFLKGPVQTEYSGLGQGSLDAISGLTSAANQNTGLLNNAATYSNNLISNGGLTAGMNDNISTLSGIGDTYGSIAGSATNPSLTESTMMDVALGNQMGQAAPGYDTVRQNAIDAARTAMNRQYNASGRLGSSMGNQDTSAGIFNASAGLDYQNYQNDLTRQQQALLAIEGTRQQGLLNQMNALGGQATTSQAGFNMGQTGISNAMGASAGAGDIYSNTLLPYQKQLAAQGLLDADAAARASFDPNHAHLAKYQALTSDNASGPQPEQQPSIFDWLGLGVGAATLFL